MPPPVQLIFTDNPGSLPASYTLPPNLDIELASVRAKINGAGASGSFLVCLSLYSQDDRLMARVPLDTTYAAGDTGEGTWAPFLRSASSGSTPVTSSFQWVRAVLTSDMTITSGVLTTLVWDVEYEMPGQTAFLVNHATTTTPWSALSDGYYAALMWVTWSNTAFTDVREIQFDTVGAQIGAGPNPAAIATTSPNSGEQTLSVATWLLAPGGSAASGAIHWKVRQSSGSNKTITDATCNMFYLGAISDFFP